MGKGGRRRTTWEPGWNLGKTKVIRVPEVITEELMEIARHLDTGGKCLLQGNQANQDSQVTGNAAVVAVLRGALTLKANAGGAIKMKIREALHLLGE